MEEPYDNLSIYCRKLGHHLKFSYCRQERGKSPCPKIIDCWFEQIPIQKYLSDHFSPHILEELISSPPQEKMITLVELIKQAQQRTK